jgi:hypothetical protein
VTAAAQPADARSRPKAPGIAVLVLTAAVAVLVAVIGITARAAPPPTVAQFAPQAVQQIKHAPDQQNSEFGEGQGVDGVGGGGGVTTTTTTIPPTTGAPGKADPKAVPVSRRCIGNPPRQIEDAQSPPCIAFWEGDNGGATWRGVTADTIKIAAPFQPYELQAFQSFFNRRFEFYGRKLEITDPKVTNSGDPEAERNDAASVDAQGYFASTGYSYNMYYSEELAKRKIISVTSEPYYTEKTLQELSPYVWQYGMTLDKLFDTLGAWVCRRLADKPAIHAGDVRLHSEKRAFGIIGYHHFPERHYDFDPLRNRLKGCGAADKVFVDSANPGNGLTPQEATNEVLQMQQNNVTTVICTCEWVQLGMLMRSASSQGYQPEWIGSSFIFNDEDAVLHTNETNNQLDHYFGLSYQQRELRQENQPASWALIEGSGQPDSAQVALNLRSRRGAYHDLLMLASGIQMAGPRLTPETFQQGLQKASFPNPPTDFNQGRVSFQGDHSMTEDVTEYYWSSTGLSPYVGSPAGAVCYFARGARSTATTFPSTDPNIGQLPCESRDI